MIALDQRAPEVFAALADTLGDGFDLDRYLDTVTQRCVELLGVAAAGLLLVDEHGTLSLVGASGGRARWLQHHELHHHEGPSTEARLRGQRVHCPDLSSGRWPRFAPAAAGAGYAAVHALPMRLRSDVIGGLSLFTATPGELDVERTGLARALARIATTGILQRRAIHLREKVVEQLQTALDSRVLIEQAKGVLAERLRITVGAAFTLLRTHARNSSRKLTAVAAEVVDGSLTPEG